MSGDAALLNRVQKLLSKAEATPNPHEAEAFSLKAAELVAKHRIDPSRLVERRPGEVLEIRDFELGRGAYVRARLALLMAVAGPQDVRVVFSSGPTGMVAHAAGFTSDLDLAEMTYNSLHQQAASQMATIKRATPAATQRFRRSFLFGYADRVEKLLEVARHTAETESAKGTGLTADVSTELALQERVAVVEDFLDRSFGRIRAARPASGAQVQGWVAGSEAAGRADVGRSRLSGRPAIGP